MQILSDLHQQEHRILRMVTTTFKWSNIHLDRVHSVRGGVESRQRDVLMPEGGLKLGEGESAFQNEGWREPQ